MYKTSGVRVSPLIKTSNVEQYFELDEKIHKITQSTFYQRIGPGKEELLRYQTEKSKLIERLEPESTTKTLNSIDLVLKINRDIKNITNRRGYQWFSSNKDKLETYIRQLDALVPRNSSPTLSDQNLISTIDLVYQKTIHLIPIPQTGPLYESTKSLKESLSLSTGSPTIFVSTPDFSSAWKRSPDYTFDLTINGRTITLRGAGLNPDKSLKACGGFGRIFFGIDPKTGKEIAVKIARKPPHDTDMSKLELEADFLLRIQGSSNVLSASEVGFDGDHMFVLMDKLQGTDLYDAMENRKAPLSKQEKIKILLGVVIGLRQLHDKNILHRDIKPENIWVTSSGDAIVLDLGLSKPLSSNPRDFSGTSRYMAPEVFVKEEQNASTDVYSFGLLMHDLFTHEILGERYIDGKPTYHQRFNDIIVRTKDYKDYSKNPAFYNQLKTLTESCLKIDPTERISVEDLIFQLNGLLSSLPS